MLRVYIDYNQDGDFFDTGERVYGNYVYGYGGNAIPHVVFHNSWNGHTGKDQDEMYRFHIMLWLRPLFQWLFLYLSSILLL